ncbi:MAG: hypothetical protein M1453_03725 [Acidobacteria bacterium]|nr:hypothetical protein [Acidobacteriota bacterium]
MRKLESGDELLRSVYSKFLRVMNEPSLWELSKDQKSHSYRFLWLRTFDNPIAVRVIVNEDGTGTLVTKILSGQGGYDPGRLRTNRRRKLSTREVGHLLFILDERGFWSLPSEERLPEGTVQLDGAQWITEGVKGGAYHVVYRWSPETGRDRAIGLEFLVNLAKLKLLYTEVY